MIYINKNFTRRNYDCTNVVIQHVAECEQPRNFGTGDVDVENWIEYDAKRDTLANLETMMKIGGINGNEFFGYM